MLYTVLALYALASLVTFAWFYRDKRAARLGLHRTPERTLHALSLVFGVPGALIAIFLLRHKSSKPRFYLVTVAIAAVHVAAWSWYFFAHA